MKELLKSFVMTVGIITALVTVAGVLLAGILLLAEWNPAAIGLGVGLILFCLFWSVVYGEMKR